ncbi:MAG: peptide ABC transporter substrate-binding protein [Chloroflexi bacterium]|nr:peptide ABC transporter substrate-binding protein [Chloroflexota bacterium]
MKFLRAFLFTLILTYSLTLLSCRSTAQTIARDLRLNLGLEPATLDPALASDPGAQQIARMLFLSLVDTDAASAAPQPALAASWAVSADGLIWEFKLRPDAVWVRYVPTTERFETKRAVNAHDVVYSVRRLFDPRLNSSFAPTFAPLIRGAEDLRGSDPQKISAADFEKLFLALGVQASDDSTVRFTLTRPASDFPSIVSVWLVRVVPREVVDAGGSAWTEPGALWTNGPYVLERWSHNREIILKKNPLWYAAESVRIERIRLAMIADTATALDQFQNGNLDSLDPYGGLTPSDLDRLKDDPLFAKNLRLTPTGCTHYYGFNLNKPPFNDVLVRKAFTAALDREVIVSSQVKLGEPARWFTRPGILASPEISETLGIAFNAPLARDFLRQAGYDKKKLPPITLAINTNDTHERIAEAAAQMWKTNLGAEITVKSLDWKGYLQTLREDPPQLYRLGWCAYVPDASNFLENVFRSNAPDNVARWNHPPFDRLIESATRETDVTRRRALYRAAEKIIAEDNAVILPLWWAERATLSRPELKRTFAITDGYERFETWRIE